MNWKFCKGTQCTTLIPLHPQRKYCSVCKQIIKRDSDLNRQANIRNAKRTLQYWNHTMELSPQDLNTSYEDD